jgi:pimeloyl-ACP methyl ester carboxylesterase
MLPQRCVGARPGLQEAALLRVEAPCLLVVAARDPLCPPAELAGAVARMPSAQVHAIVLEVRSTPLCKATMCCSPEHAPLLVRHVSCS